MPGSLSEEGVPLEVLAPCLETKIVDFKTSFRNRPILVVFFVCFLVFSKAAQI